MHPAAAMQPVRSQSLFLLKAVSHMGALGSTAPVHPCPGRRVPALPGVRPISQHGDSMHQDIADPVQSRWERSGD
jgi:hypothetical protein